MNIDISPPGIHGLACKKFIFYLISTQHNASQSQLFACTSQTLFNLYYTDFSRKLQINGFQHNSCASFREFTVAYLLRTPSGLPPFVGESWMLGLLSLATSCFQIAVLLISSEILTSRDSGSYVMRSTGTFIDLPSSSGILTAPPVISITPPVYNEGREESCKQLINQWYIRCINTVEPV